ncbi:MAG TPA: glycosyl hydrolase family 18 protein, partial [Legionellaceae bacterium]|nr:glycosyl hydrolase family 18 protein [Legionellaceae bacterium]
YLSTLNLHFPSYVGSSSSLPKGASFQIIFGNNTAAYVAGSTNVYLQATAGGSGTLKLVNKTTKPSNVNQTYGLVHLTQNGQSLPDVQVPWGATQTLNNLSIGSYSVMPQNVVDTFGKTYQGTASPSTITIENSKTVTSNLNYTAIQTPGSLNIKLSPLPDGLGGYSANPSVIISQISNGSSVTKSIPWGTTTNVSQLTIGNTYGFSTPDITYNGNHCTAIFNPSTLIAAGQNAPITQLIYNCVQVQQDMVTINIQNAPTTLSTLKITLTPNNNGLPISQTINLNNGSGSTTLSLPDGGIYTLQTDTVSGYTANFSLQPLTVTPEAVATISFSKSNVTEGRIIGYLPGWKTPPAAQDLAAAGYTHILVAFGVFSTSTPGAIVSAFDTVTPAYVQSLHQHNIKVLLSLGGASSSIANTSVDFHAVLSAASSSDTFKQNFINSLKNYINTYGFDGFDIDIEHGLIPSGTFTHPQGDIALLADIINTMYAQKPGILITLAPQVANISATSGFDQTWGNYASLIRQTYQSLAWVGIQLYNTGCAYGLDQVCYDQTQTNSPNFSVAMAADLLENWPSQLPNGRATGFQPYIANLQPSQVVLGYPAPNISGASDGAAVIPTSTIKRAVECLKTATVSASSCDTYISPKAYGTIGGVFNWEVTYDQNNNFRFAKDLQCAVRGICNN